MAPVKTEPLKLVIMIDLSIVCGYDQGCFSFVCLFFVFGVNGQVPLLVRVQVQETGGRSQECLIKIGKNTFNSNFTTCCLTHVRQPVSHARYSLGILHTP